MLDAILDAMAYPNAMLGKVLCTMQMLRYGKRYARCDAVQEALMLCKVQCQVICGYGER